MTPSLHDPSDAMSHPLPSRLAAFGLGDLAEGEAVAIAEHLSTCDACRSLVEAVEDDSLAGLFRRANGPGTTAGWSEGTSPAPSSQLEAPSGYVFLGVLGEGGMGVVSKARQVALGRFVALKQLRPEVLAGPDGVARFRREAEAVARLRHPNIVPIFDIGWRGEVPYYSMEYVEGGTLRQRLAAGPVSSREAARLVETLARAVQHAHDSGVVHRDLKPANILLAPDLDHPKVGDFGLAKLDDDSTRTRTGVLLGTPNYMSPEQAEGDSSRVGPSTDVYALGAILYESLAGRPPFLAPSVLETLEQVRRLEPTSPRRLRGSIPRDLETIALKCLEKPPARRYASALALADDLRRHLDGETIRARAASNPERLAKWARRRPWQATSASLGVVVLFGSLAGTLVHNARLRQEVRRTELEAEGARAQRARAEAQYRSARDAIGRMIARLDEPKYAGQPLGGELGLRRRLLEDALAFFEGAVRDDAPAEPANRLDKARVLLEVATFQLMLGESEPAGRTSRRSVELLEALEAEGYADPDLARAQVAARIKSGLALAASGRSEGSLAEYRGAIARAERANLGTPAGLDDLAWGYNSLGSALLGLDRASEALPYLSKSSEIRRAALATEPGNIELRSRLAETLINLAYAHGRLGELGRAEAGYAEAAEGLEPIIRDHPGRVDGALALGKLCFNWGWIALQANQVDRALERFRKGLGPVEAVRRSIPDWPEARGGACQLHSAIALALQDAGRPREAIESWDRAIALAGGSVARTYRLGRLASLARAGEADRALLEARSMADDPSQALSGVDLYNFACVAAVVAGTTRPDSPEPADEAAEQALRWLRRAFDVGTFRDPGMIRALDDDADLASIRTHRGFRLLRLDAAFPAEPFAAGR